MDENEYIKNEGSKVTFQIQDGPIKEYGVNGCQIGEVIQFAKDKIELWNKRTPCRENSMVITKLDEAIMWIQKRTKDREKRGVEGTFEV